MRVFSLGNYQVSVLFFKTLSFSLMLLACLATRSLCAKELNVAVASNFYHALSTISRQFEQETGIRVKLSSGASGLLYAQIIRGAPFDLFFSADIERPELLEKKGLTSERETYVYGRLALWVPKMSLTYNDSLGLVINETFLTRFEPRLAIANPRLAPYGKAAEQTIEHLGLSNKFNGKLILGNNINQTYQFVDSGNAVAGFVAYSLIKKNAKNNLKNNTEKNIQSSEIKNETDYWLVPQRLHQPIAQQAVLLKSAKNSNAAQKLLSYILSTSVQKTLLTMGYRPVQDTIILGDH